MESLRADLSADALRSAGVVFCDEFHGTKNQKIIVNL
jgi:hypothetical protein